MSKKEIIKEQAAKLFRKRGYNATSMRNIAKAVGMQAASLYNHTESKQEILQDLCMPIAQLFSKGMKDVQNSSLSPIEKLEKLIGLHVRLTVENPNSMALVTGEWVHLEDKPLAEYTQLREEYEENFKQILTDCVDQKQLQSLNIEVALFSILSTLHWLYSWHNKHPNISPIELEKQMIHCLLDGLK